MSDVAEFVIVRYDGVWVVSMGDQLLAGFPSRSEAESMVNIEVDARRNQGKASRIIVEDGLERQVQCCLCYTRQPRQGRRVA
jgi:hypothetical protein